MPAVAISDRQQTQGEFEYEQSSPTNPCGLVPAFAPGLGSGADAAICESNRNAHAQTAEAFAGAPSPLHLPTRLLARLYSHRSPSRRRPRAGGVDPGPVDLGLTSFGPPPPGLVREACGRLRSYESGARVIMAGVDAEGPHMFAAGARDMFGREAAYPTGRDSAGSFAAGSGGRLFNPHVMAHGSDHGRGLWETSFPLYSGKKKAGRAGGVGKTATGTMIATGDGGRHLAAEANGVVLDALEGHSQRFEAAVARVRGDTIGSLEAGGRIQAAFA